MSAGQSRLGSALESAANVAIGWAVALVTQIIVLPWYGAHLTLSQNLSLGCIFTAISLARSYLLRRAFNHLHRRWAA